MKIGDKYLVKDVESELAALRLALEDAQLSGTGATIGCYEKDLASYFGSAHALAQATGSAALHTALYCLGVREGDEVLIPAIAPIPTVLPLLTVQAKPVVVDCAANGGLGFDPDDLKKKINSKTKAAILVPLWGYPIDYSETLDILQSHHIPLIEDAAQAHGTQIDGKYVGTFGRVGCFSTHDRKLLPTGEGGFILTDDAALNENMKQFSQLGYMDGKTYGVNHKLSALQGALGSYRLQQISSQIDARASHVETILSAIEKTGLRHLPVVADSRPNYYSFVLLLPWERETNTKFIARLSERGIPSDITKYGVRPLYQLPMFASWKTGACPNTEWLMGRITTIPVHPGLTPEEVEYIGLTLVSTFQEFNS